MTSALVISFITALISMLLLGPSIIVALLVFVATLFGCGVSAWIRSASRNN